MTIFRRAVLIVGLTFILAPLAGAQEQTLRPAAETVRVTSARDKVHVAIGGDIFETRVEVASADGEIIYESGILSGNSFDWELNNSLGARVAPGDYTLTITYRTPAGKLMRRTEQVTVPEAGQKTQTSDAGPSPTAVGTIIGEGTAGKIAKFNGTNSITNSAILTESAGKLLVNGALELGAASGAGVNPTIVNPNNLANFALVRFYPASGTNVNTSFTVVPRGTGQPNNRAQFSVTNTDAIANPNNVEFAALRARGADFVFGTGKSGTGVIRPLMFSAGYLSDNATNNNQLVLATNGSVGIGTATPTAGIKLEVNGITRMTPGGSGGYMQFGNPNSETGLTWNKPGSPDTRADIRFDGERLLLAAGEGAGVPTNSGLVISTSGAVGIGTVTPTAGKLHVVNDSSTAIYGSSSAGLAFAAAGNVQQSLDKGGWVKAMAEVDEDGNIVRCFNSQDNSSSGTCGFTNNGVPGVSGQEAYTFFSPFTVENRFVSITTKRTAGGLFTGVNYSLAGSLLIIRPFVATTGAITKTSFTFIIY